MNDTVNGARIAYLEVADMCEWLAGQFSISYPQHAKSTGMNEQHIQIVIGACQGAFMELSASLKRKADTLAEFI